MSSNRPHDGDPLAPHRGRLLGLAYRMLGSRSDAEDVVQDAYLRFAGAQDVHNAEAFLVTVVTRLCLDRLKSARAQREVYVGPWLPEPVFDAEGLSADAATELADDLSFALLLALDRLSPLERAACRQLASRARRAVRDDRPAPAATPDNHARLLQAFGEAVTSGNVARLAELLREDAVAITDGGGRKTAARNPIQGADKIARFFIGLAAKNAGHEIRVEPAMINGAIGALLYLDGELDHTMSMAISGEKIAAIYIVRNPDKLRHLPAAAAH